MRKFKTALLSLCAAALLLSLSGCAGAGEPSEPRGKAYFTYFDTVSYVYSYAGDSQEEFDGRCAEVSALLGEYHRLFDIYHEYSGINNLCTINRLAGGEPVGVDKELIDFLLYARELYYDTEGEMDIMLGPVLSIWHERREAAMEEPASAELPSSEKLSEAALHCDMSLLEIDPEKLTVRLSDPEASLDVGAIGKGYAVERAAEMLSRLGAQSYVLNVGGNIRCVGTKPDGSEWSTGVKDPSSPDKAFALQLKLSDASCVTSGNYERYYTVNGLRFHHIIDKDTLSPADYFASVTVVTEDSAIADALSTALFCMPCERGVELADKLGADVLWIFPDGELKYTPGMARRIITQEETDKS